MAFPPKNTFKKRSSNVTTIAGEKPPSRFVAAMRRVYRPLGFQKGYNFPLFVLFAGAMLAFAVARTPYFNVGGSAKSSFRNGSSPGAWYHYRKGFYRAGITIHLFGCIPAAILLVWQFVPVIRHKFLIFHRINGHVVLLLTIVSNIGALMIARRSFGGSLDTQTAVGTLAIMTTTAFSMGYYNIKKLQLDHHRAWMMRGAFYMGSIITTRAIFVIMMVIISKIGGYHQIQSCNEILFLMNGNQTQLARGYPSCFNTNNKSSTGVFSNRDVIVGSNLASVYVEQNAAAGVSFGSAMWLAIILHLVGVEIYLNLTATEGERLKNVSHEQQMEQGDNNPRRAGLTADRCGDCPKWIPQQQQQESIKEARGSVREVVSLDQSTSYSHGM